MRGLLLMCVMGAGGWPGGLPGCFVIRRLAFPRGDPRHRVVAAGVPRVATSQTFHRKPAAVECSEALYGLQSVMRAGGMETAAWTQEGAHEPLINTN